MTTASASGARRVGWKGVAGWLISGASFCVAAQVGPAATATGSAEQPTQSAEAQAPLSSPQWVVRLPSTDPVAFKGVENFDSAGVGSGAMAYPAPNAAGLLVAVIAHSMINEAAKNAQKVKLKEDADRILTPYRSVLSKYTHAELARSTKPPSGPVGQTLQIDSVPVFALTQDQTALVLDNEVSVKATGVPIYEGVIRVVSAPLAEADPVAHWSREDGAALRLLAGDLLQESIELAASAAKALPLGTGKQQTFRYYEGKTSKVERATLLVDGCARRVLLTLRETLMSVPVSAAAGACTASETRPQAPEKTSVDTPAS
ncbi:hypothetical protein [Variovorax sp. Sphag1AA]|uniref:hypothetical protein n=1 Tax=Variovorax sp. Sphag1AA TaxID=2587027 RepID=UPI00161D2AC9|nr:hypothetical protein [Variovorax sp. Sphag1AA]MBB3180808.1 hypothetical protein [Variovorax sp. Sphag1AA]